MGEPAPRALATAVPLLATVHTSVELRTRNVGAWSLAGQPPARWQDSRIGKGPLLSAELVRMVGCVSKAKSSSSAVVTAGARNLVLLSYKQRHAKTAGNSTQRSPRVTASVSL